MEGSEGGGDKREDGRGDSTSRNLGDSLYGLAE